MAAAVQRRKDIFGRVRAAIVFVSVWIGEAQVRFGASLGCGRVPMMTAAFGPWSWRWILVRRIRAKMRVSDEAVRDSARLGIWFVIEFMRYAHAPKHVP